MMINATGGHFAEAQVPLAAKGGGALVYVRVERGDTGGFGGDQRTDARIAELLDAGLYAAGQQALAAARQLRLNGRNAELGNCVARTVNSTVAKGLTAENSSSAQLGLALALVGFACNVKKSCIASGCLDNTRYNENSAVLPVAHLGAKMEDVLKDYQQPGRAAPPSWFFVPKQDPDGVAVEARYAMLIAKLEGIGITVAPVESVLEACAVLGLKEFSRPQWQQLLKPVAAVAALIVLGIAINSVLMNRPVDLSFSTVALPQGEIVSTPLRFVSDDNTNASPSIGRLVQPCLVDAVPQFVTEEFMFLRLRSNDLSLVSKDSYFVLVHVGEKSGVKVLPLTGKLDDDGKDLSFKVQITPPAEQALLAFVAKRRGWNAHDLETSLRQTLKKVPSANRISTAKNWLYQQANTVLPYDYKSTNSLECV